MTTKQFKLTIFAMTEIDENNQKRFLHNFFDCPVCKTLKAGTGIFGDLEKIFKNQPEKGPIFHITCSECGSTFFPKFTNGNLKTWIWEYIIY